MDLSMSRVRQKLREEAEQSQRLVSRRNQETRLKSQASRFSLVISFPSYVLLSLALLG